MCAVCTLLGGRQQFLLERLLAKRLHVRKYIALDHAM